MPAFTTNYQAVDMWTMRLRRTGHAPWTTRVAALPTVRTLRPHDHRLPPRLIEKETKTMNPTPELSGQLKQLRLSGILDSLEARNREAVQGKLAYTDFLAMLIGDEVARREIKKFSMRMRRAQFRTTKTLEHFEFERLPKLNRTLIHDLATGRYLHEKAPVLMVGPSGIGKSHLAQALGHCAVRQGHDVVFTSCAGLTQSLNAARATGAYDRRLAALSRVPLLIIDDFGLKPLRAPADEDLHDVGGYGRHGTHLVKREHAEIDGIDREVQRGDHERAKRVDLPERGAGTLDLAGDGADIAPSVVRPQNGGHDGHDGRPERHGGDRLDGQEAARVPAGQHDTQNNDGEEGEDFERCEHAGNAGAKPSAAGVDGGQDDQDHDRDNSLVPVGVKQGVEV